MKELSTENAEGSQTSGFRCAGRKTERVGGTQQSNEHQKTTKQVKKEKAEERKAAYLHGPRQLKDDGPR
eukprot:CAMPEP_0203002064 /NCGR_PEP_ID=MMETSP1401-20130829/987_1 /ASSEMBLY_ACC=CAM_ASM_000894 /TAXON_ID=38833 /ORGANISM="Micromonas pusilla, Strain CCAC1681" /LENGTH=68 /DNA_ID=CAMNT_0049743571 /DNA_START=32 /DNA_END=235 /DNA_ORIENTATION=-